MSETLEEMSKTKNKLNYLMQQRKQAMEREDYESMVRFQAKIDALKIELGVKAGRETVEQPPPMPETETYVAGVGVKIQDGEITPSPRSGARRTPWDRDHRLTVGDLSKMKEGDGE